MQPTSLSTPKFGHIVAGIRIGSDARGIFEPIERLPILHYDRRFHPELSAVSIIERNHPVVRPLNAVNLHIHILPESVPKPYSWPQGNYRTLVTLTPAGRNFREDSKAVLELSRQFQKIAKLTQRLRQLKPGSRQRPEVAARLAGAQDQYREDLTTVLGRARVVVAPFDFPYSRKQRT